MFLSSLVQLPNAELHIILISLHPAHILAGWRLEAELTQTIFFASKRSKHSLSIVEKACSQRR
jgi:hypothetical protein